MATARIHINLTKWGQTGETPEAFIERMTANIQRIKNNGLVRCQEMAKIATSEQKRVYFEDQAKHFERKIRRWEKEIKKAQQAI